MLLDVNWNSNTLQPGFPCPTQSSPTDMKPVLGICCHAQCHRVQGIENLSILFSKLQNRFSSLKQGKLNYALTGKKRLIIHLLMQIDSYQRKARKEELWNTLAHPLHTNEFRLCIFFCVQSAARAWQEPEPRWPVGSISLDLPTELLACAEKCLFPLLPSSSADRQPNPKLSFITLRVK